MVLLFSLKITKDGLRECIRSSNDTELEYIERQKNYRHLKMHI